MGEGVSGSASGGSTWGREEATVVVQPRVSTCWDSGFLTALPSPQVCVLDFRGL